jgi:hypothetical protein
MSRRTWTAGVFAVVLMAGCHPGLPPSVATLAENSEEFSAPAKGKIGSSYVLGDLAVEVQVAPAHAPSAVRVEQYRITAHGRQVTSTIDCHALRAGPGYAYGAPDDLSCHDGRGWILHLHYFVYHFAAYENGLRYEPDLYAATADYAIEAELSDAANVFRFRPARINAESNTFVPLPETKPVAAVVHQPFRNTILLARDAPHHDALLAAAAIVMTVADRVHPGQNPCSPGSLPGEQTCRRLPE